MQAALVDDVYEGGEAADQPYLTHEELDKLLERWAYWVSTYNGPSGFRLSGSHPIQVIGNRARVEYTNSERKKLYAKKAGINLSDPSLDLHIPWMSAKETKPRYTPYSEDDAVAARVDLAIRMMRDEYNKSKQGRLPGYGDRLFDVLKVSLVSSRYWCYFKKTPERTVREWLSVARNGVVDKLMLLDRVSTAI